MTENLGPDNMVNPDEKDWNEAKGSYPWPEATEDTNDEYLKDEDWDAMEAQAEREISDGEVEVFASMDEAIAALDAPEVGVDLATGEDVSAVVMVDEMGVFDETVVEKIGFEPVKTSLDKADEAIAAKRAEMQAAYDEAVKELIRKIQNGLLTYGEYNMLSKRDQRAYRQINRSRKLHVRGRPMTDPELLALDKSKKSNSKKKKAAKLARKRNRGR